MIWNTDKSSARTKTEILYTVDSKIKIISSLRKVIFQKSVLILLVAVMAAGSILSIHFSRAGASPAPIILGELPYQKLLDQPLTDRADLLVNAADGNVILQSQDLNIESSGPALSVTRYFNDLSSGAGQVGSRDTISVGTDVHLTANGDGSVTYQGPSGFRVTYPSNGSGGYTIPASYEGAILAPVTGGGWTLTFGATNEVYTFNAAGNQTKDISNNGQSINYAYNTNGTLASATDSIGRVTTFTNYSGTNVGTITDPSGRTIQYTYNSAGQLTGVTDAAGEVWQFQYYDTRGNINQITDPRGYTTTLAYNSSNQVTSIVYDNYTSASATYTYAYNSGNTVVTDPLNHNTTYTYDSGGRVTNILNAIGDNYGLTYDSNNNLVSTTDPSSKVTTYTYDTLGSLLTAQNPSLSSGGAGAKTSYSYGNAAHPYMTSVGKDTQGNLTSYSYDTNGNVVSAASSGASGTSLGTSSEALQGDPNSSGGTITCGAQTGEVCTSTDQNGNVTSYGYDTYGDLLTVTPPGSIGAETITYDGLSRISTLTDGNGSKSIVTYDADDRPTLVTYAKDSSTIAYHYDADGNLTERDDTAGQTLYTYDGFNNPLTLRQTGQANLTYTYDAAGNLKTEQGSGGTTTYSYDNANQIAGINQSLTNANETFVYTAGRPVNIYIPGNITETIGYDQAGRETSISAVKGGTTLSSYTATYVNSSGADTNLMQSEINNVTGVTTNYTYDGLNRLTAATQTGSGTLNSYTYTYDANGNRTQYSHNGSYSAIFGFNSANELSTNGGATDGSYDANGNQASTGTGLAFGYNAKNQVSSFTPPSLSTQSVTYTDSDQANRTAFGSTTEENGLLGVYSDTTGGSTTYYTHLPSGTNQALGETMGNSTYYYLTDLHGSTVAVTDGSGTIQDSYTYDPYGNLISSTGTVANPWRYQGGYYDSSTGLYKFGERYYNPGDGRWTQLDPSAHDPGYEFAGDDPVNLSDPTGTKAKFNFQSAAKKYQAQLAKDQSKSRPFIVSNAASGAYSYSKSAESYYVGTVCAYADARAAPEICFAAFETSSITVAGAYIVGFIVGGSSGR
jgi:RHS repeat-associated protein